MRRLLPLLIAILTFAPASASALTLRDVIELTRAGLGEDVLLALLEVDPSVFPIDTATLKMLKEAGVSEKVIIAMIRSGRMPPPPVPEREIPIDAPPARDPQPQVVVIDHRDSQPPAEVVVPVPVYVPVYPARRTHRGYPVSPGVPSSNPYSDANRIIPTTGLSTPPAAPRTLVPPPVVPEYWGNGGKLRPDAWGQPKHEPKPAPRDDPPKNDPRPRPDPRRPS
jgi:hypothetical protein